MITKPKGVKISAIHNEKLKPHLYNLFLHIQRKRDTTDFDLYTKLRQADSKTARKLRKEFPMQYEAFTVWTCSKNKTLLFARLGFMGDKL